MNTQDFLFLLEAMLPREERGLLKALREAPDDFTTRAVYVDYLLDTGRPLGAEMVRGGYTPVVLQPFNPGAIASGMGRLGAPPVISSGYLSVSRLGM